MWQQLLICSTSRAFVGMIQDLLGQLNYSLRIVRTTNELEGLEPGYKANVLILDCHQTDLKSLNELASHALKKFKGAPIGLVHGNAFDPDSLQLTKTSELSFFHSIYERSLILNWLFEVAPIEIGTDVLTLEHLSPIRLVDFSPEEKFDFDLYYYMPANRKILLYRRKDSNMSAKQLARFRDGKINDLYVRKTELKAFHEYFARRLKNTMDGKGVSKTEKIERVQSELRTYFRGFFESSKFSERSGGEMISSCKKIVSTYLLDVSDRPEVYENILQLTSRSFTNYNHALNVSLMMTMFSFALGIVETDPVAIAGLLHDIGLSSLPKKLDEFDESLDGKDLEMLHRHPSGALELLEEKKLPLEPLIYKIIQQHHENFDGSGYPKRLKGDQIEFCARLCAIADYFDHLTSIRPQARPLEPLAAIDWMIKHNQNPQRFDPEMLKKIRSLFIGEERVHLDRNNVIQMKERAEEAQKQSAEESIPAETKRARRIKSGMKY